MPVVRIIHVQKNPDSPPSDPRFEIRDSGQNGNDLGFSRQGVGDWLAREGLSFSAIERVLKELDQTGSTRVQVSPRIGPRIVRAWFDTVFNPLIPCLEFELLLIGKRNWTFSFRLGTFERIRPAHRYLAGIGTANLGQILQLSVITADVLQTHDDAVERLQNAVAALHKALATDPEFTRLCDTLLAEAIRDLGLSGPGEIFGAYPESDRYKLLAQDIVNSSEEQSSHYSTAKFWNRNREALLKSLSLPSAREYYASTIQLGSDLASASQTLMNQLKDARQELSLRNDVPYYTVADPGSTAA